MVSNFLFIDKTLAYGLKNRKIDESGFIELKKKIDKMTFMIYDIQYNFLQVCRILKKINLHNVRICVGPDKDQVIAAHNMGCRWIKLNLKNSGKTQITPELRAALETALKMQMKVTVGCIDISEGFLTPLNGTVFKLVSDYNVDSVIVHDYKSSIDPIDTLERLAYIKEFFNTKIEYGGKNGFGLATGNSLAAVKSGCSAITTSIGGIGGFPAYEEVVMAISRLLKLPIEVPDNIAICCEEVLEYIGIKIPKTKPIIGANIFAHESGIHVDGVYKKSELYEPFTPEEVGLSRRVVIGKHSGRSAIEHKIQELNISMKPSCAFTVLEKVRQLAIKQKAAVADEQLIQLVQEVALCDG